MAEVISTRFAIIGAGAGGLCTGIKLLEKDCSDFLIFDREPRVGGTWQRNTYPGAACDIACHLYCYSFAPNPDWSRPFPPQPEIREYFETIANDYGLVPHLRLGTTVNSARWQQDTQRWQLAITDVDGGEHIVDAQFLVSSVGMFGPAVYPNIEGLNDFGGALWHSAAWNHDYDLRGKRVAVIGSAASAVQFVPEVAKDVEQLYVFQRTPNWVLAKDDEPYTDEQRAAFRENPQLMADSRQALYDVVELSLTYTEPEFFEVAEQMGRDALQVVEDPELRAKLTPDHPFGAKRPLASNNYLQTFNRSNVELVTDPITRITPGSVVCEDGSEREVDAIILATGFETQQFASVVDIYGRNGQSLNEAWQQGPKAHYGVTTSGFPNLFMLYGPNTNGGNSIILMLEYQIEFMMRLLDEADQAGARWLDVKREVMDSYNAELQKELDSVEVWRSGANDYYRSPQGNIVTQWPHNFARYSERVEQVNLSSFDVG